MAVASSLIVSILKDRFHIDIAAIEKQVAVTKARIIAPCKDNKRKGKREILTGLLVTGGLGEVAVVKMNRLPAVELGAAELGLNGVLRITAAEETAFELDGCLSERHLELARSEIGKCDYGC